MAEKYYVDSVLYDCERFEILLSDSKNPKNKVLVKFECLIGGYRLINESFTIKIINYLDEKYGGNFYGKWTFFKVNESSYLKWLTEEAKGLNIAMKMDFMHFSFLAIDYVVDVLATRERKIEFIGQISK